MLELWVYLEYLQNCNYYSVAIAEQTIAEDGEKYNQKDRGKVIYYHLEPIESLEFYSI